MEIGGTNGWDDLLYAEDIRSRMKVPDRIVFGKESNPVKDEKPRVESPVLLPSPKVEKEEEFPQPESTEDLNKSLLNTSSVEFRSDGSRDDTAFLRKQISKMNHRLMAVELQNEQLSQRFLLLCGIMSSYLFLKFVGWFNRVH